MCSSDLKNDINSILNIGSGGGTDLDIVITTIERGDKPAIVLTDADDYIREYSTKAFLLGVADARFDRMDKPVLERYYENKQIIVFNGEYVMNLDASGRPIMP